MRDSKISSEERLLHIAKAIADIESYMIGIDKDTYLNNDILINATLFQFVIIGEAIIHVDDDILSKYNYPWYKVRGFRNFIVHEYHAIEFWVVWEAINKDIPKLKNIIEQILKTEFQ